MKVNELYKISDQPTIYLGIGSKHWMELSGTRQQPVYLLTHPMWHFNIKSAFMYWRISRNLRDRHVKLIMLGNTEAERGIAKMAGLNAHFINQNIHVCEHRFQVIPGTEKKYDAVYIAAAKKYKRIELARLIKKLYFITYFWPDIRNDKGEWDLHAFEPSIAHADFNRHRLSGKEISRILNESRCGLALSRKEGAMLASLEYQLSGLPVVTTPSIGGRDVFLDPEHTLWVSASAERIAEAVKKMVAANHDPYQVRSRTLENLEKHRVRFYQVVAEIIRKEGHPSPGYEAFHEQIWGAPLGLEACATRYNIETA